MNTEAKRYDAFISYSHADDRRVARTLHRTLERFGSWLPWRRRLRIFRDEVNLAANPDLWRSVEKVLDEAGYLVLLASPRSARSEWVEREIRHFLSRNALSRLCIALMDGRTRWTDGEISPAEDAIPPLLEAEFSERRVEPLIVDLRAYAQSGDRRGMRGPEFLSHAATIVAGIQERDKDEIFGERIGAQRRGITLLSLGIVLMAALAVAAFLQYRLANRRLQQAVAVASHMHEVVEERLEPLAGASSIRRELLAASSALLDELLGQTGAGNAVLLERVVGHVKRGGLAMGYEDLDSAEREFHAASAIGGRNLDLVQAEWPWALEVGRARIGIGDVLEARGDLTGALDEFERARTLYGSLAAEGRHGGEARRQLSVALARLQALHSAAGQLDLAADLAARVVEMDEALARQAPGDRRRQADLAVAYTNAADVALKRNEFGRASGLNQKSRKILEDLLEAEPYNADVLDIWITVVTGLGNAYVHDGKLEQALAEFELAESRARQLVEKEPSQRTWRRYHSAALNNIASVHARMGDERASRDYFEKSLETLAEAQREDPGNALLTADAALVRMRQGDLDVQVGRYADALARFEEYVCRTYEELHRRDPGNGEWTRSLMLGLERTGNLHLSRGEPAAALEAFERMEALAAELVERNPRSPRWKHGHAYAVGHVAEALDALGREDEAVKAYRDQLRLLEPVVGRARENLYWQSGLATALLQLGEALLQRDARGEALALLERSSDILTKLVERSPRNLEWQTTLAEVEARIAEAYIDEDDYPRAERHIDRCRQIARAVVEPHPADTSALHSVAACEHKHALLALRQDDPAGWIEHLTETVISFVKVAASSPEDLGHRAEAVGVSELLGQELAEMDGPAAEGVIRRLGEAAREAEASLPTAARDLRLGAAIWAMDLLASPALALPLLEDELRAHPEDPDALCSYAEVTLALGDDPAVVEARIERCIEEVPPGAKRLGPYALAVAAAVLRNEPDATASAVERLRLGLEEWREDSAPWRFAGLKAALERRRSSQSPGLVPLFDALEAPEASARVELANAALDRLLGTVGSPGP